MNFRSIRKWWWLLILAPAIASWSTYHFGGQQPPVYEARTILIVGRAISDPNPTSNDFYLGQQLAGAYADIAEREPVQIATMNTLELEWLPRYEARTLPNSQMIEILVEDTNPSRAQAVANELAHQLILKSPTNPSAGDTQRLSFVTDQLNYLELKILETQNEIVEKQLELADLDSARQIVEAQNEISALQNKLATLQGSYAAMLTIKQDQATNTISVIEPASLPVNPIGPDLIVLVVLAGVIGLGLSIGAVYLMDYFDDSIKTVGDVESALQLPVLGFIPELNIAKRDEDSDIHPLLKIVRDPLEGESFRILRTNLQFSWKDKIPKSIMITSFEESSGKSMLASALAFSLDDMGRDVMLIDADLQKPEIHQLLDLNPETSLRDLVEYHIPPISVTSSITDSEVKILASGDHLVDSSAVYGSVNFLAFLTRVAEEVDIAIFDSPPLFMAGSILLASRVDGVLLVIEPGVTRQASTSLMMKQLERAGANILGVVFNRFANPDVQSKFNMYTALAAKSMKENEQDHAEDTDGDANGKKEPKVAPFKENSENSSD
jgi:capsular exopolysaccharide synthesis family protein